MSASTSYPYDTIVYITDTIGGQGWQGSGVLISPDEVLTASHVVYNSTNGTASNITVTPGYDAGSAPFGSATGTGIHYFSVQDPNETITGQQSQYDFAVIHLSQPFTGIGTMGLESGFSGGVANVSGYPASLDGQLDNSQQTVTEDPDYTLLDGTSIGKGSSGGPVWVTGSNGEPEVVGVVSSAGGNGNAGNTGYFGQITTSVYDQIEAWVAQDDGTANSAPLTVQDTTTGQTLTPSSAQYTGSVSGLQNQYISITTDNLNISATTPNWFIAAGSGETSITVASGTNILDGGTGSDFLTGGSGDDTFYLDARDPASTSFSTIANFHSGDNVTVWGVTPSDFTLLELNNQGAAGFTGLDLVFTAPGRADTSFVLAGYTSADLTNGRLSSSYGTTSGLSGQPGSQYLTIHAT